MCAQLHFNIRKEIGVKLDNTGAGMSQNQAMKVR